MGMRAQPQKKNKKNGNGSRRRPLKVTDSLDLFNMNPGKLTMVPHNRTGAISSFSSLKQYNFVRATGLNHQTFTPGSAGGISFALDQVLTADFTALFDEYRICAVTALFYPDNTTVDAPEQISGLPADPGMLETMIDYDDATTPVATDFLENQTYRVNRFLGKAPIKVSLVPRVSAALFKSSLSLAYGSKARQWIDLAAPEVPHYGIKYRFSSSIPDVEHQYGYYYQVIYYLQFRGVR